MSSRRRPLHTCGVSIIRIAQRARDFGQDLIEPLASNSKVKRMAKIASFASTFVPALLYFWLLVLSFVDDQIILFGEDIVERFFPPSRRIFDKIDGLVQVVETLPEKFDYTVKEFSAMVHKFPFLDWALVHVISLLKLLIATLTYWGSEGTREKEIMVDINCDNWDKESESEPELANKAEHESTLVDESDQNQTKPNVHVEFESSTEVDLKGDFVPVAETEQEETETVCAKVETNDTKSTHEEVIEKGKTDERSEIVNQEETRKESEKKDGILKDDPIIEMFESGWLMRRGRRGKGGSVSGPLSYA